MSDNNTNTSSRRKKIKVFLFVGPGTSGLAAHKTVVNGKSIYRGFHYEVLQEIVKLPHVGRKFQFEIIPSKEGYADYQQVIDDIRDNKYDMAVSGFLLTYEREKVVDFTVPIALDNNVVFHRKSEVGSLVGTLSTAYKSIGPLIMILFTVGIVMGLILYFGNPRRMDQSGVKTHKQFFMRSIISGIAAMFGEMGYVSENSTPNFRGLFVVSIVMFTASILLIVINARLTSSLVTARRDEKLDKYRLTHGVILGLEGYKVAKHIEKQGGTIKYMKNMSLEEIFEYYYKPENINKYLGVASSFKDGSPFLRKYTDLTVTTGFGTEPASWPTSNKHPDLKEAIDTAILQLRGNGKIMELCKKYYGDDNYNMPGIVTCTIQS